MPIVSHTLEQSTHPDGGASNVVRLYDQDAREYTSAFLTPAGFDIAGRIAMMIAEMDIQLAEAEFEQIVGAG